MKSAARLLILFSTFVLHSAFAAEELKIAASSTGMLNVFSKIDKAFEKATGIKIVYIGNYETGDSYQHLTSVLEDKAEASTSGTPSGEFLSTYKKTVGDHPKLKSITYRLLAKDLIEIFANKENGVTQLTSEQIEGVFSGRFKNWKEVGGKDLAIKPVTQTAKIATLASFRKLATHGKDFTPDAIKVQTHADSIAYVAKTPGSVGFGPNGSARNGTIEISTPPIGRPIFLLNVGKPSEKLQKMIDFVHTEGPKLGVGK